MEKMIVANHKMNMTLPEIENYIEVLEKSSFKPIVCPTSIYAKLFVDHGFETGLQNIYLEDKGAYTGEISPKQAKSIGINCVIIGHSERRQIFKEDNSQINQKIKKALENDLKVILCIGETLDQRNNYQEILSKQITESLKEIDDEIIIAYEPVWAIGTGITPTNEEIDEITKYIKSLFSYDVKVLYGGSVSLNNIASLKAVNVVSGYLIGGASTKADELIKIGEVVS